MVNALFLCMYGMCVTWLPSFVIYMFYLYSGVYILICGVHMVCLELVNSLHCRCILTPFPRNKQHSVVNDNSMHWPFPVWAPMFKRRASNVQWLMGFKPRVTLKLTYLSLRKACCVKCHPVCAKAIADSPNDKEILQWAQEVEIMQLFLIVHGFEELSSDAWLCPYINQWSSIDSIPPLGLFSWYLPQKYFSFHQGWS